ncbi:helix-turn-helix domain-containing protein, partial [Peptostreptococcus sp. D1]|uniref:helix-turn-helix domain-containing protein n=1 Tax=Peptostreptococcus sp. D1 TaxID=72304 RepID=UPI0008F33F6C
ERNVKRTELARKCKMSNTTLAKLNKNKSVTLTVIDKICKELDCKIEDVVEIINEEEK